MVEARNVQIGVLSPATPHSPHFKSLGDILPPGVAMIHEGLGLLGESYQDLAGKTDRIIELAGSFVRRHDVSGLMVTGGFVTLFNPGLEKKLGDTIGLPVVGAISSAVAALTVFRAKTVLLMTPFDAASDRIIKAHLSSLGFTVQLGPAFEDRKAGSPVSLSREELFRLVGDALGANPPVQAIYFQGATMDPLPILQRLEDRHHVPVVTSNSAMIWHLLSRLGLTCSIQKYGQLLEGWPPLP
jgi:maleate cis-trans isomerase